jgi:hypothetical protein
MRQKVGNTGEHAGNTGGQIGNTGSISALRNSHMRKLANI